MFQCSCSCFLGEGERIGCVLSGIRCKSRERWEPKADWLNFDRFKTKRHSAHFLILWNSSDMQIALAPHWHHQVSREVCLPFTLRFWFFVLSNKADRGNRGAVSLACKPDEVGRFNFRLTNLLHIYKAGTS